MTSIELLIITLFFTFFTITAQLVGLKTLEILLYIFRDKKYKKEKIYNLTILSASLLVGIGVLGNIFLLVGLLGLFNKPVLLSITLILFIFTLDKFPLALISLKKSIISIFNKLQRDPISAIFIVTAALVLGSLYLSSMQPPNAADELHYHLPQAREVAINQKIGRTFSGHYFYGNLPKLMETLFAYAIAVSGFQLAHLINFLIMFGLFILIFSIVNKHYTLKAASISLLLLTFFDDLTWNGTSGYIDTAALSFEIGALLLVVSWLNKKSKTLLVIAFSLIGIALAIKYSPLITFLFIATVITVTYLKGKKVSELLKKIAPLMLLAFVFGGYWYSKNLILHNNPFYPLLLGHSGVPENTYINLINAIQRFRPKTLSTFFELIGHYKTFGGITVYLSIFLPILVLLAKSKWKIFHYVLLIYYLVYLIYWFFFATHQIRFLAPGLVIAIILTSIVLSQIKLKHLLSMSAGLFLLSLYINFAVKPIPYKTIITNYFDTKLHMRGRQFALGNINQTDFLTARFGCQYSVIKYLENNNLEGKVIDNWSVWHAPSVSFYAINNKFITFGFDAERPIKQMTDSVQKSNIRYIYFNEKVKEKHINSDTFPVRRSKDPKIYAEGELLKLTELVYSESDCRLYEIVHNEK